MDIDKIASFHEVVLTGSVRGAAQKLHLSESGIRAHIRGLEKDLDVRLFSTINQRLTLTHSGSVFFAYAKKCLKNYETMRFAIHKRENLNGMSIRLSITLAMGYFYGTQIAKALMDKYDMSVNVYCEDGDPDLNAGSRDLAIRGQYMENVPNVAQVFIRKMEMGLYASEAYLEKYGRPKTMEDLKHHRLIGFPEQIQHVFKDVNWHLHLLSGEVLKPTFTINSNIAILRAVSEGLGIGSLSDYASSLQQHIDCETAKLVQLFPEIDGPTVKVYGSYDPENFSDKEAKVLMDIVKDVMGVPPTP